MRFLCVLVDCFAFLADDEILRTECLFSVAFQIVMYAHTTLNGVYQKYQKYHKQIHAELLKMKRAEIYKIAKQDQLFQDNKSFQVRGDQAHNVKVTRGIRSDISFLFTLCFIKQKQIVNIVEGPKLITIIFMGVYVCMMHVLDTFPGSS